MEISKVSSKASRYLNYASILPFTGMLVTGLGAAGGIFMLIMNILSKISPQNEAFQGFSADPELMSQTSIILNPIILILSTLGFYTLYKLLISLSKTADSPFVSNNIKLLKRYVVLTLVTGIFGIGSILLTNQGEFDLSFVWQALIVLGITWIFERGKQLQDEKDLTV